MSFSSVPNSSLAASSSLLYISLDRYSSCSSRSLSWNHAVSFIALKKDCFKNTLKIYSEGNLCGISLLWCVDITGGRLNAFRLLKWLHLIQCLLPPDFGHTQNTNVKLNVSTFPNFQSFVHWPADQLPLTVVTNRIWMQDAQVVASRSADLPPSWLQSCCRYSCRMQTLLLHAQCTSVGKSSSVMIVGWKCWLMPSKLSQSLSWQFFAWRPLTPEQTTSDNLSSSRRPHCNEWRQIHNW